MYIMFLNVPDELKWNEGARMGLDAEISGLTNDLVDVDLHYVADPDSKIHVLVSECPSVFPVVTRKAVAKQIFWFLKYHGKILGSDVYFSDFVGEKDFNDRYFLPSNCDFG